MAASDNVPAPQKGVADIATKMMINDMVINLMVIKSAFVNLNTVMNNAMTAINSILTEFEAGNGKSIMQGVKAVQKEANAPSRRHDARFIPPTLDKVSEYCRERGNAVDAETFINFYASKGWKVGNQDMKDWRAAVRTWEKKRKDASASRTAGDSQKVVNQSKRNLF